MSSRRVDFGSTAGRRGGDKPQDGGDGPSYGAPTVALPDETLTAYLNSGRFMAVFQDRWGGNVERTFITQNTGHITVPPDLIWKDVHALDPSVGDPLLITPRHSGWIEMTYSGAVEATGSTTSLRLTFQVNGERVTGAAQNEGIIYTFISAADTFWVPATVSWIERYPLGEPLEIRLNARGGTGTCRLIGAASTTIMYAKEVL